ncbi:MAG: hypothetical protein H7335_05770 [Massilia sp.]|nr:hypothetical protein [Massilia sp.]
MRVLLKLLIVWLLLLAIPVQGLASRPMPSAPPTAALFSALTLCDGRAFDRPERTLLLTLVAESCNFAKKGGNIWPQHYTWRKMHNSVDNRTVH